MSSAFTKIGEKTIEGINAKVELYVHNKHGCQFLNIENDDKNNFFSIAFKTAPPNDKGTPHVTEHMVLHGSNKYPVTDVFGEIDKRSINTYLNAFTYPDLTCYPVGSMNEVDFHNLMDVYLDCVLRPTFRLENFLSETFHREFQKDQDPTTPLINAGVVFNEMKGVYSSQDGFFEDEYTMHVLKGTLYEKNYGGNPDDIKTLTRDELVQFHHQFYHPSNSMLYHYGSFDKEKIMKHIDDMISPIEKMDFKLDESIKWIPEERKEPETIIVDGPFDSSQPADSQIRAGIAWLIGDAKDRVLFNDFDLIESILVGSKGTPLYDSLIKGGLGSDFQSEGFNNYTKEMFFSVGLKGMSKESLDKFEDVTFKTLQKLVDEGISREAIEAGIHQIFVNTKRITGNYGLLLFTRINHPWEHGVNPLDVVDRTQELEALRDRALNRPRYLESVIEEKLLKNKNRVKFIVMPSEEFNKKMAEGDKKELEEIRKSMTPEQDKECMELAQHLKDVILQQKENIDSLPSFKKQDLDPKVTRYTTVPERNIIKDVQSTNGLVDIVIRVKCAVQPSLDYKLIKLLTKAITECGTKTVTDLEFATLKQRYTASLYIELEAETIENQSNETSICFNLIGSCLTENFDKMLELVNMFFEPNLDNTDKIKVLLSEMNSRINDNLTNLGHYYARKNASRTHSRREAITELITGATMFRYIRDVVSKEDINKVSQDLKALFNSLLSTATFQTLLTTTENDMKIVAPKLEEFMDNLTKKIAPKPIPNDYSYIDKYIEEESKKEKIFYAYDSQTNFLCGVTSIPYYTKETGIFAVTAELLSNEFINPEIRQKLGAYGAYCLCYPTTERFVMLTYRDGTPAESYAAIQRTLETAAEKITDEMVDNAILQVAKSQDKPISPSTRGIEVILNGTSYDKRQLVRDSALAATKEQVIECINILKNSHFVYSIYGNKANAPEGFIVDQF